jgi:phosphoglycolate phosphatase
MVGDSQTDIATAKAARIPVVAVDFGYTEIPVSHLGADRIISHFNVLLDSIEALLQPQAERASGPAFAPPAPR